MFERTVFYEDKSIAGIVTLFCVVITIVVIAFSERPLLFLSLFAYKIQFYPAIYHSASTLSCLSLFFLCSHCLM